MPLYEFENIKTGERFEQLISFFSRGELLKNDPNIRAVITAPRIVSGVGDRAKNDAGFNEVMSKIAENNPQSPLAATYGAKDTKSVKTRDAVRKAGK